MLSAPGPADRPAIAALIAAARLPPLPEASGLRLVVARDGARIVAVAGVEVFGRWGLLRSVAVDAAVRGTGLGARMVLAAEALADDLDGLFLLTTAAASFFAARGYVPVDRADVPGAVRASDQFAGVCPASAVCMRRA